MRAAERWYHVFFIFLPTFGLCRSPEERSFRLREAVSVTAAHTNRMDGWVS